MLLNGKQVFIGPFLRKQERDNSANKSIFSNVFVKNLSETITKENLEENFGEYGDITSAVVMREGDRKSKCFGFVNFVKPEDVARAVEELNGKKIDDMQGVVCWKSTEKKSEREVELKGRFDQSAKDVADKFQGVNLYIKSLDDVIGDDKLRELFGDDKLRELFSEFGTMTSCKVIRDSNGISRGFGFVSFSAPEDASHAPRKKMGK
ncbi:polyadenylate-binding protein 2-like [Iris pallida]|uniref:Polyadenylate-binding protein 2-like n=1 Tax=Iris pallida TaxID=29817 RepID=A0AAX6GCS5_IRIPA|nr:polyadenylate-binding protein 2-like [Iris pallida]